MFQDIKKILPRSVMRAGIGNRISSAKALKIFAAVIGPELEKNGAAGKIKPLYIKDKVITAASLSAAAADILAAREDEIIAEINQRAGDAVVEKIRYLG